MRIQEDQLKPLISRPIQKWGATMMLTFAVALVLIVAGTAMIMFLPPGYYVLALFAVLAIGLNIMLGRVIRWLAED